MQWRPLSIPLGSIVLLVLGEGSIVFAETINLKNGSVIKGSIVEMNETDIIIDTSDLGQVKVNRRTVRSITDQTQENAGKAESNGPININISNQQTNDQKLDNKNDLKQSQNSPAEKEKEIDKKSWKQGLYGRFLLGLGDFLTDDRRPQ
jgi:hypothetical protein